MLKGQRSKVKKIVKRETSNVKNCHPDPPKAEKDLQRIVSFSPLTFHLSI